MRNLCIGSNLYASHSLETALREISGHGVHAVDLWASPTICNHIDPKKDDPVAVRKLLDRYELEPVSLTAFLINDEDRLARMKFASEIGVPVVIWEPAQSPDWKANMTNLKEGSIPFCNAGGTLEDYVAKLKWYLEKGRELKLKIGIEIPHRYTLNEYLYQIWRTANAIEDNDLVAIIAPPHADARGYDATSVLDIVGTSRAYMLYLWDVRADYHFPESDGTFGDGKQQMPGGGGRNFGKLISYFINKGFDGWFNISCHGVEGWQDIELMNSCLSKSIRTINEIFGN